MTDKQRQFFFVWACLATPMVMQNGPPCLANVGNGEKECGAVWPVAKKKLAAWPGVPQRFRSEDYDSFYTWLDVPWSFSLDQVPCPIVRIDLNKSSKRFTLEQLIDRVVIPTLPILLRNAPGRLGEDDDFKYLQDLQWVLQNVEGRYPTAMATRSPSGPWDCLTLRGFMDRVFAERGGRDTRMHLFQFAAAEYFAGCGTLQIERMGLLEHFSFPLPSDSPLPHDGHPRLSLSPDLRGLPFHQHRYAFNERLSGRKLWLFYETNKAGFVDDSMNELGNRSMLSWVLEVLPTLSEEDRPRVCMQQPGEVMLIPTDVWHATLNIGDGHQMSYG